MMGGTRITSIKAVRKTVLKKGGRERTGYFVCSEVHANLPQASVCVPTITLVGNVVQYDLKNRCFSTVKNSIFQNRVQLELKCDRRCFLFFYHLINSKSQIKE